MSHSGAGLKARRSTTELLGDLSREVRRLLRDELQLARYELSRQGKRAGIGAGALGLAGIAALFGFGLLLATAVLALALVLPAWLSTLIVGAVVLIVAGGSALMGKSKVQHALPPVTDERLSSVKQDIDAARRGISTEPEPRSHREPNRHEYPDKQNYFEPGSEG